MDNFQILDSRVVAHLMVDRIGCLDTPISASQDVRLTRNAMEYLEFVAARRHSGQFFAPGGSNHALSRSGMKSLKRAEPGSDAGDASFVKPKAQKPRKAGGKNHGDQDEI